MKYDAINLQQLLYFPIIAMMFSSSRGIPMTIFYNGTGCHASLLVRDSVFASGLGLPGLQIRRSTTVKNISAKDILSHCALTVELVRSRLG